MRKPDFHRENPEQRISIVLGGVVLRIWDFVEKIRSPSLDRPKKYFWKSWKKSEYQGRSKICLRIE